LQRHQAELELQVAQRTAELMRTQELLALVDLGREALQASESHYRRLFETAHDGILLLNADTAQIEDVNPYLIGMLGYSHAEFLGKKLWEVGPFADVTQSKAMFAELQTKGYVRYEDLPLKTKAGARIQVEFVSNTYDCADIKVIQCNIRDITERKVADAKIQRHMQLYAALSQCNKAIVHCANEEELFQQVCRAAVQFGGMKFAWIGIIDTETLMVRRAASFGDDSEYLKDVNISVDGDSPFGNGPTSSAIRKNQPVWCQDLLNDQVTIPCSERTAYAGLVASASLPLHSNGNVIGALTLYASEANAFDEAACDLLVEMATDISFTLDNFARETARKRAKALDIIHYRIFEQLAQGDELSKILSLVVSYVEQAEPDCIGSVMLLDKEGKHLLLAAAPSLPCDYKAAIDGIDVADGVGSCGTAVWRGKMVIVTDIRIHPYWTPFKYLAVQAGLLSCWSEPILNSSGKVLGAFDIYRRQAVGPSQDNLELMHRATYFAAIAIERTQVEERQRVSEFEFRTLVENSPEMIVRYDCDCRCIYVNQAYERETGIPLVTAWNKPPVEDWKPEDYIDRLKRVMETGKSEHILVEWHQPDGSLVSHDMHAVAEYDKEGGAISVLVMGHNITKLKETERNLEASRADLHVLTVKREEAREEERKRIAREIHDELGQLLSVLRLNATTLDFRFGDANLDLRDKTQKMVGTADLAILMVRNLATRLRPAVLSQGIVCALEWMVQEYFESTSINCRLHIHTDEIQLDEDRATVVFRIVQESLTNVLRHSGSDRVDITLRNEPGICEVEVRDYGKGFDLEYVGKRNSYGIIGMQERALLLKGTLDISATEAGGTVVKLRIPLTDPLHEA
jgi:PAS domain S-box-containing protein